MKDIATPVVPPQAPLRQPDQVMRLARMGASFPTRLSFLRALTRRLGQEGARLARPVWQIDADGYGHAVYTIPLGGHEYSLVAVSTYLPDDMRTDRVIATAWDTTYVLYDGVPDATEVARLLREAPRQEAGRFTERDLVLCRANKSVRLFAHVVERLRAGAQPDPGLVNAVGYLMRTTAVYGNGKFGIADRGLIADRPGLSGPFAAEMLAVWMVRSFTHDLAEHLGGGEIARGIKRHLGIGNSTGLGMAPFLVSHPVLLNNWMLCRETALARVRAIEALDPDARDRLRTLAARAALHLAQWNVPDPDHQARIEVLRDDWTQVESWLDEETLGAPNPLDRVMTHAETLSLDAQELTSALLIEPFGDLVDGLCDCMADPFGPGLTPLEDAPGLRAILERHFDWALGIDFDDPEQHRRFWYVSEEKMEPRLGDRFAEPGADLENPLDIARRIQALHTALDGVEDLRAFRQANPEHELAIRRAMVAAAHPYSEIRDNLIAATCLPIDMLRCKLAFFGATKFDPKSDRWTRVALAQGAPLPDELGTGRADDWWLTELAP